MKIDLRPAQAGDLVRPTPGLAAAVATHFEDGTEALAAVLATVTQAERPAPWGAYWGAAEGEIVGLCAFKAAPDGEGAVEIAYYCFPSLEGRGIATGMAAALVEIASQAGAAAVVAHTLPAASASTRVLEKLGFSFEGEAEDPEDGTVWAWRRRL